MLRLKVVICGSALSENLGVALMQRLSHESFMPIVAVPDVPRMDFEIQRTPDPIDIDFNLFKEKRGRKTGHDNFQIPEFHHNKWTVKKRGWGK